MSDRERLQALKEQALQMKDELSKAQEIVEIDDDDALPATNSRPGTGASTSSGGRAAAAAAALPPPATTRRRAAAAATAAAAAPSTTTATTNEKKENNGSTDPPEEDEEQDKVLLLLQMDHQKDIKIKVNKTHLFEKVFEAYAKAKKLNRNNLVFTFNDDELNDLDQPRYIIGMETLGQQAQTHTHTDTTTDPTPNVIKVTDRAALEAARAAARAAAAAAEEQATKTVEIVLQWGGGGSKTVRMKACDPFKKMMDRVCEWKGKERSEVRFSFDGEALKEEDTPEKLDMEDGDKVDVYGLE